MNLEAVLEQVKELLPAVEKTMIGRGELNIQQKGEHDFVTRVDLEVSEFLLRELPKLIEGSVVLSEEAECTAKIDTGYCWIIDPVDGTTNFIYSLPLFAVSIGLLYNGRPVLGVVHNPAGCETFTAVLGGGAFLNGKQIKVCPDAAIKDTLLLAETNPYHPDRKSTATIKMLDAFFADCKDIRITGSAALDVCYVAAGRAGVFVSENLKPWDFAGGLAILREAGGTASRWDGSDLTYSQGQTFVATNKILQQAALQRIQQR